LRIGISLPELRANFGDQRRYLRLTIAGAIEIRKGDECDRRIHR